MRPGKIRFDIQPEVFKKKPDVLKKENNSQNTSNNHLDQVTATTGVDINHVMTHQK